MDKIPQCSAKMNGESEEEVAPVPEEKKLDLREVFENAARAAMCNIPFTAENIQQLLLLSQIIGGTYDNKAIAPATPMAPAPVSRKRDIVGETSEESANKMRKLSQINRELSCSYQMPKPLINSVRTVIRAPPIYELIVNENRKNALLLNDTSYVSVDLTTVDVQWLKVLSEGWASPLAGFMRERQYLQSLHFGHVFDLFKECPMPETDNHQYISEFPPGTPVNNLSTAQSVPIVLTITDEVKAKLEIFTGDNASSAAQNLKKRIQLKYNGNIVAILKNPEVYRHRKKERVHRQFATDDVCHPGVRMVMNSGDWLLGGEIEVFGKIKHDDGLDKFRLTPFELRKTFMKHKSDVIFAYQPTGFINSGHILMLSDFRAQLLKKYRKPMLLFHPLGGWTDESDSIPLETRMKQYLTYFKAGFLDPEWTIISIFPSPMLYAGPLEAQWHARTRRAAGVNYFLLDRCQESKPEGLYDSTHDVKLLSMTPGLYDFKIIPYRETAYNTVFSSMSFYDETKKKNFIFFSEAQLQTFVDEELDVPYGYMIPSAWEICSSYYRQKAAQADKTK